MPAAGVRRENLQSGLRYRKTYGRFLLPSDIPSGAEWEEGTIQSLKELMTMEPYDRSMQTTRFYGAEACGYIDVPKDAVYIISSVFDQVWIDGRLVIDNGTTVKKNPRNDNSIALMKGLHSVRVVFLSNIIGGWYSSRGRGEITYRKITDEEFHTFRENRLFFQ